MLEGLTTVTWDLKTCAPKYDNCLTRTEACVTGAEPGSCVTEAETGACLTGTGTGASVTGTETEPCVTGTETGACVTGTETEDSGVSLTMQLVSRGYL